MNLDEIKITVLTKLFDGYKESPTSMINISDIILKSKDNINEIVEYLTKNKWMKNYSFLANKYIAQITVEGIKQIEPNYTKENISKIIKALINHPGKRSVMEILKYHSNDFQKAFDLVKYAEEKKLLEKPFYMPIDIFIKLSSYGKEIYEKNKSIFCEITSAFLLAILPDNKATLLFPK